MSSIRPAVKRRTSRVVHTAQQALKYQTKLKSLTYLLISHTTWHSKYGKSVLWTVAGLDEVGVGQLHAGRGRGGEGGGAAAWLVMNRNSGLVITTKHTFNLRHLVGAGRDRVQSQHLAGVSLQSLLYILTPPVRQMFTIASQLGHIHH